MCKIQFIDGRIHVLYSCKIKFIWLDFGLINQATSLCRDPNTIFRGNSLTSKCIDETMKLAGMHYLQVTLKPIIDEVCHSCTFGFVYLTKRDTSYIFTPFGMLPMNLRCDCKPPQICTEHKPCEIDPVKLKESENLETNRVRGQACLFVCFEVDLLSDISALPAPSIGKPSPLCRPHLQCYHHLRGPLSHCHVWHLLFFERVCCHPLSRYFHCKWN